MLTLFAVPKPFVGPFGTIQRNAIASWTRLGPSCRVVLFGDEQGTAETARELGALHVPEVERNEHGTPLVSDLFARAHRSSPDEFFCYANADVIFASDLVATVERVAAWRRRFLLVGQCWNVDLGGPLALDPGWMEALRTLAREQGTIRGPDFIDYFVFSRGLFESLPPFAVGRAGFDNWLVWRARDLTAPVVDATPTVTAVHQSHDYSHLAGGSRTAYGGAEAQRNTELAGGRRRLFTMMDATHTLTPTGLRRNLSSVLRLRFRMHLARMRAARLGALLGVGGRSDTTSAFRSRP